MANRNNALCSRDDPADDGQVTVRPLLFVLLLCLASAGAQADDHVDPEADQIDPVATPSLDLKLRYDPAPDREEQAWGALKVTAKLDSTQIYLDGVPIGTGQALRAQVLPGLHLLEARLPSGRKLDSSVLIRPGQLVEYEVNIGNQKGQDAYLVLMNVVALVATTVVGSAMAMDGSTPIPTDMPGLTTGLDAMKSGNRQLPRP